MRKNRLSREMDRAYGSAITLAKFCFVDPNTFNTPTANDFAMGRVTSPDQSEIVRQRLYDFLLYPTAGQTQLAFFSQPIGQGVTSAQGATVGAVKSALDTNLQLGNTLPSGKAYNVMSIEVQFWPGSVSTTNTYTPSAPNQFATADSATPGQAAADVNTIYQSGLLQLAVLDKVYVSETPLSCFPPQTGISVQAAVATNSSTAGIAEFVEAKCVGRPYVFDIPFSLLPSQNFGVTISWPSAVATPSGFNGRIGVIFDGYLMRATQ